MGALMPKLLERADTFKVMLVPLPRGRPARSGSTVAAISLWQFFRRGEGVQLSRPALEIVGKTRASGLRLSRLSYWSSRSQAWPP
jgi:hypothetical protein